MTGKNQLRRSGTRLRKEGTLWFQQTWNAGETLLGEAQTAGVTFGRDMGAAGTKFAATTGRSTQALQGALHREAREWQALVLKTRDAYVAAAEQRLARAESQALSTRAALQPGAVETAILRSVHDLLERAQAGVDARLSQGAKPAAKAPSKAKAAKAAPKAGQIPLRNYDQLTAKDVATRVQRLSAPQANAILDYEKARKKRATVIRAVEQRLAAAS
jgi:hypothetical protein